MSLIEVHLHDMDSYRAYISHILLRPIPQRESSTYIHAHTHTHLHEYTGQFLERWYFVNINDHRRRVNARREGIKPYDKAIAITPGYELSQGRICKGEADRRAMIVHIWREYLDIPSGILLRYDFVCTFL